MRESSRNQPLKADVFSARLDVRLDLEFKKQFSKFCKNHHIKSSETVRQALQQYMNLGNFKKELFEYLHSNVPSRKKFEEFLKTLGLDKSGKDMVKATSLMNWFTDILGTEEEKLIRNTPFILLASITDTIITPYGKKKFEERLNSKRDC